MFDNLLDLVKSQAGNTIINNPAIPNEHNDAAVEVASSSIFNTLKNAIAEGNLNSVIGMFSTSSVNTNTSPLLGVMQNNMVQNLVHQFGLDQSQAENVASGLLPNVLQNLIHKTNDPNDNSFNIQSIVSSLIGNVGGGFDVRDLLSEFTENQQQPNNTGGGMIDSLNGLYLN
jgi:uncharacterized protein YidB (DUF937 family)